MKRTKIFSSICMLVLTLACLTFGVYSAVKTDFTASGTITFNAYNLDVDAKVTITGTEETYEPKYLTSNSERTEHIWTGVTYSPMTSLSLSNLTFDELGEHQNLINIHFEFVNYSNYQVEAIAETTTSGSAWDSNEDVSKLLYQPTMQTLMDSVEDTSQNTSGFSIMFTPKGQQITGTAENMSIEVTLKPAEQEYTIETDGLTYFESGDVYDRLNYNNLAYAIKSDATVSVGFDETNGDTTLETYPIPTKIFGRTVDEVYEYAFNCEERVGDLSESIQYMFIPESVETISDSAFTCSYSLKDVILSNGLIFIDSYAFSDCSELDTIIVPNSVTKIGESAFQYCDGLQCETIGNGKYLLNEKGEPVILMSTVDKTITNIDIPETVFIIHSRALEECKNLTNVKISSSVTSVGNFVFSNCDSLISISVEKGNAIYDSRDNCNAIIETSTNTLILGCKNTVIPNSVTSVGSVAFLYCSRLTSITIPSSVTSIGDEAFSGCYALAEVYNLSSSITLTKGSEDNGCLAKYVQDEDAIYTSLSTPSRISEENGVKYYTNGSKVVTLCLTNCLVTSASIKAGCTKINQWAFSYCSSLTSLTIPSSVTSIEMCAFFDCSSLTSLTIEGATSNNWAYGFSSNVTYATGTKIDLTNPATNAKRFVKTYKNEYFVKQA